LARDGGIGHPRPSFGGLAFFASGDLACNLYWQSVSLFLLFYYSDVLGLSPALAGLVYAAGAVWDGLADIVVGIVAQRSGTSYRSFIFWGAAPLGVAFIALYLPLHLGAVRMAGAALLAQIGFRSVYALINVPYAAWSARISDDSGDRATLAGFRMLFGALAAVLVSLGMPWIGLRLTGNPTGQAGFLGAAILSAAIATPMLLSLSRTAPEMLPRTHESAPSLRDCWRALACNRAFVTLNLAAASVGMAAALFNQSILYYFKHVRGEPSGGSDALAIMALAGTFSVPVWMLVTRRLEARATWFAASAIGISAAAGFVASGDAHSRLFLIILQIVFTGLNLGFWAMLPNTVEYGELRHGIRVEAMAFGVAAFVQKMALAAAAGVLGAVYARIGYAPGGPQAGVTLAGIRWLMLGAPALGLATAAILMLANPLRRGAHANIVERLTAKDPRPDG
jgi:GPH family glycoside/pentoside/hexuronide:cation symporter